MVAPMMKQITTLPINSRPQTSSSSPQKAQKAQSDVVRMQKRFSTAMNWQTANQGTVNLFLIPLFALSMAVVFRRRRRLFMEHVVFLLHSQSAVHLLSLPLLPFLRTPTLMMSLTLLPSIVYYPLAIRQVYGPLSWPKTLLASLANAVLSLIFIYAVMLPLMAAYFLWPWSR
jgi:hypothetical protein